MGINVEGNQQNVNVNIGGSVYLGNEGKIANPCDASLKGTFERNDKGCYYYCDGIYRQLLNMSFTGDDIRGQCTQGTNQNYVAQQLCTYGATTVRPGDKLDGYIAYTGSSIADCASKKV